ncbi:RBBP9/YdeN family alpha/beta hydrolase [Siphonobacter sp.]|uniref:RBBP9/YdeN family alpha/beta hydrolase n=1 Tax=Siphonobacter sp. TaxID=1869184 RepID=UPI003B3BB228
MSFQSTVLIHPGLGNSGEGHWQTLWQDQYNLERVQQRDWETPICTDWVQTLDKAVLRAGVSNVILVGHSLACVTIAYWAELYKRPIKAALLVAPSDTEAASYPSGTTGFSPMPTVKLPFPSIVVRSTNDPYMTMERAQDMAEAWGSELITITNAGHINVGSGYGSWPAGLELLQQLDHL